MSFKQIDHHYQRNMGFRDSEGIETRAYWTNCISNIMLVALFALSCITIAGVLPVSIMGWTALGIGAGTVLMEVVGGKCKQRTFSLLATAFFSVAIMTIGALGGAGVLATTHVGFALLGITSAQFLFYCCGGRGLAAHQIYNENHQVILSP